MGNWHTASKGKTVSSCVAAGTITSILVTVILMIIFAILINGGKMEAHALDIARNSIVLCAVLTGTLVGVMKTEAKILIIYGVITGIYLFSLIATNIIVFDGEFAGLLPEVLMIVIGAGVSFVIKVLSTKRKPAYKKKY